MKDRCERFNGLRPGWSWFLGWLWEPFEMLKDVSVSGSEIAAIIFVLVLGIMNLVILR